MFAFLPDNDQGKAEDTVKVYFPQINDHRTLDPGKGNSENRHPNRSPQNFHVVAPFGFSYEGFAIYSASAIQALASLAHKSREITVMCQ
jgi:hypothetical protein